jgi:hypothetical protein
MNSSREKDLIYMEEKYICGKRHSLSGKKQNYFTVNKQSN